MTRPISWLHAAVAAVAMSAALPSSAGSEARFGAAPPVDVSFVEFQSPDLSQPPGTLPTIQGKLSVPGHAAAARGDKGQRELPAVLILHGSAGVDARGDFYEAALNKAGIATLQIDMWQARGYSAAGQRPAAIVLTYPDAFSALAFGAGVPVAAA